MDVEHETWKRYDKYNQELSGLISEKAKFGKNIQETGKKIERQEGEHNSFRMVIVMTVLGLMIYPMEKGE